MSHSMVAHAAWPRYSRWAVAPNGGYGFTKWANTMGIARDETGTGCTRCTYSIISSTGPDPASGRTPSDSGSIMAKKATAHLRKYRDLLALVAVSATVLALAATWMANAGEMPPAWHRLVLHAMVICWFGAIGVACTMICIAVVYGCGRTLSRRMDSLDERMREHIKAAVSETIDVWTLAQDARRRSDRG